MSEAGKKTVLIDGDVHPNALALFDARNDVELVKVPLEDATALAEAVTGANGILARSARITPELIASANGLQVVSRHGVGYDRVDVEALTARNIPLAVTGTANSPSVAEHAMMFMLACAKRLRPTDRRTREGDFLKARQELGRVEKTTDAVDRRRTVLTVSARGRDSLAELAPYQRQVNDVEFGALSADDFRELSRIVAALVDSSEQAVNLQRYLESADKN